MNKGFLLGLAAGVGLMLLRPAVQMAMAADQPHMQAGISYRDQHGP